MRTYGRSSKSFWIWMRPTIRFMDIRKAGTFTATTIVTATCPYTSSVASFCRERRTSLERLLDPGYDENDPLFPGFEILQRRSGRLAPIAAELNASAAAGQLAVPLPELAL